LTGDRATRPGDAAGTGASQQPSRAQPVHTRLNSAQPGAARPAGHHMWMSRGASGARDVRRRQDSALCLPAGCAPDELLGRRRRRLAAGCGHLRGASNGGERPLSPRGGVRNRGIARGRSWPGSTGSAIARSSRSLASQLPRFDADPLLRHHVADVDHPKSRSHVTGAGVVPSSWRTTVVGGSRWAAAWKRVPPSC
jgi:hypothetical protein